VGESLCVMAAEGAVLHAPVSVHASSGYGRAYVARSTSSQHDTQETRVLSALDDEAGNVWPRRILLATSQDANELTIRGI